MTPREKKLMGLVALVAVLAAGDFAVNAGGSLFERDAIGSKQKEAEAMIAQTSMTVASLPLTADKQRRFAATNRPLLADPVSLPDPSLEQIDAYDEALPFIRASGFMSVGSIRFVIIDGEEYQVGETIPQTGEVVIAFDAAGVWLRSPETDTKRRLLYQEEALPGEETVIRQPAINPQ